MTIEMQIEDVIMCDKIRTNLRRNIKKSFSQNHLRRMKKDHFKDGKLKANN